MIRHGIFKETVRFDTAKLQCLGLLSMPDFFSGNVIDPSGIGLDIEHRGIIDGIQPLNVQRTPVASDEVNHTKPDRVGAVGRTRGKHAVPG